MRTKRNHTGLPHAHTAQLGRIARLILSGLVLLALAACGASTKQAPSSAQSAASAGDQLPDLNGRRIAIGTDATYPPFESVDPSSDHIVGFDVELMQEIAKLINIEPEWKNASFDTLFVALQAREFDAVMAATTITEERKQVIAFSDPYLDVGQLVVVDAGNERIKSYADLANAVVGVQTGTTGETAALTVAQVPDAKLKRYQTVDLAFADLANGSIDAVVADGPTVGRYIVQPQYVGRLAIASEPFTTENYGIAVRHGDRELLDAFNAALKHLPPSTIERLKDKYQIT